MLPAIITPQNRTLKVIVNPLSVICITSLREREIIFGKYKSQLSEHLAQSMHLFLILLEETTKKLRNLCHNIFLPTIRKIIKHIITGLSLFMIIEVATTM